MAKLPINLIKTKDEELGNFSPIVWDNGISSSKIDIFSFTKKRNNFLVQFDSVDRKIKDLLFKVTHNTQKLEALSAYSELLKNKVSFLTSSINELTNKYLDLENSIKDLYSIIPDIEEIKTSINESLILSIEKNYNSALDSITYLDSLQNDSLTIDADIGIVQTEVLSNSTKISTYLKNLEEKTIEYKNKISDFDSKLNILNRLKVNVDKNVNACVYIFPHVMRSFDVLLDKQKNNEKFVLEYNILSEEITKSYASNVDNLLKIKEKIEIFNSKYEEIKCFFDEKQNDLNDAMIICKRAEKKLEEYHELFVGGNFIRRGENIYLNRVGCTVIVSAYLPELPDCPKPPVLPPIGGDIKFTQEPLPNCPPPICVTTTTQL